MRERTRNVARRVQLAELPRQSKMAGRQRKLLAAAVKLRTAALGQIADEFIADADCQFGRAWLVREFLDRME